MVYWSPVIVHVSTKARCSSQVMMLARLDWTRHRQARPIYFSILPILWMIQQRNSQGPECSQSRVGFLPKSNAPRRSRSLGEVGRASSAWSTKDITNLYSIHDRNLHRRHLTQSQRACFAN